MSSWLEPLIKTGLVVAILNGAVAYLVLVERKVAAYIQDRLGPNRVGPWGLLQPLADGAKFIFKEEIIPAGADKVLFLIAPVLILATAMVTFATIPFGNLIPWKGGTITLTAAPNMDIGLLFVFAIGSLGVYGVVLGGWASNNKYSFLFSGSLNMETIIARQAQTGWWWFAVQPLAFGVFLVSGCAESTRLPFDLPECEQELVGGYHTEYTAMKFGMFAFAEYLHMITVAVLTVILFFGGWHFWGIAPYTAPENVTWLGAVMHIVVLTVKTLMMIFFFMWIRWSWPRFRYDQLMSMAWKTMIPLGVLNLLVCAVCQEFLDPADMLTRCVLGWLAVGGCVLYAAMSAAPQGRAADVSPPVRPL
ncbi:MAG: NADH-quinone oxidoreductase subunit H [Planctomycetia bacterium]|nr:NADH-quinone oxidoreductase subunit H [Planctomycetia bacterium]